MGNSILWLPWMRVFRAFSSVVRQMPEFNSQIRGTVRTVKLVVIVLCYRLYSCAVVIVFLLFVCVLLLLVLIYVLKLCVLQHCHRVWTQLRSSNIHIYIYIYIHIYIYIYKRKKWSCSRHDNIGSNGMDSDICVQALHLMYTDTGLWSATRQKYGKPNVHNFVVLVSQYLN